MKQIIAITILLAAATASAFEGPTVEQQFCTRDIRTGQILYCN